MNKVRTLAISLMALTLFACKKQEPKQTEDAVLSLRIDDAELRRSFYDNEQVMKIKAEVEGDVLANRVTPFVGAGRLLEAFYQSLK